VPEDVQPNGDDAGTPLPRELVVPLTLLTCVGFVQMVATGWKPDLELTEWLADLCSTAYGIVIADTVAGNR
jgi:hypothetical protein